MPLIPNQEIVVPEKVYDTYWLSELQIYAPVVGGEALARVTLIPYNSQTLEYKKDAIRVVEIVGIFEKISGGNTVLAQAFQKVVEAIQQQIDLEDQA